MSTKVSRAILAVCLLLAAPAFANEGLLERLILLPFRLALTPFTLVDYLTTPTRPGSGSAANLETLLLINQLGQANRPAPESRVVTCNPFGDGVSCREW